MTVPFNKPNSRIFWACQAVFFEERNGEGSNNGNPTGATFLDCVQAVGVSSDNPAISLLDVGRHQRQYIQYQQQTIEITIRRLLDINSNTFYKIDSYPNYKSGHILNKNNFGSDGEFLKNYDITILYTPDNFARMNAGADSSDPDKDNVISISYLNCIITNISYSMSVDSVEETITLVTKNLQNNNGYSSLSSYNLPGSWLDGEPREGQILKRQHFDLIKQDRETVLPQEVEELFDCGGSEGVDENGNDLSIIGMQSINIDVSFDYTNLMDVGIWRGSEDTKEGEQNRWQMLNLPISINCSFTGMLRQGLPYYNFLYDGGNRVRNVDNVYTKERTDGSLRKWDEADRQIKIVAQPIIDGTYFVWDLGEKNYLTSIEYTGGDAGGGNAEATITYTNQYSDFVVMQAGTVSDIGNDGPY